MPAGGFTDTAYIVIPWHEGEPSVAAVLLCRASLKEVTSSGDIPSSTGLGGVLIVGLVLFPRYVDRIFGYGAAVVPAG